MAGVSFGGKGRVRSSDEGRAGPPCVVEFRGGLVQLTGAAESSDGNDGIHIVIIMPVFGPANLECTSRGVVQMGGPFGGLQLGGEVGFCSEEGNAFEGIFAGGVACEESGLWPVRHKNAAWKPLRVGGVL